MLVSGRSSASVTRCTLASHVTRFQSVRRHRNLQHWSAPSLLLQPLLYEHLFATLWIGLIISNRPSSAVTLTLSITFCVRVQTRDIHRIRHRFADIFILGNAWPTTSVQLVPTNTAHSSNFLENSATPFILMPCVSLLAFASAKTTMALDAWKSQV